MSSDLLQSGQPGLRLHGRNGAGSGPWVVRGVRRQHNDCRTRARRAHLMSVEQIRALNDAFRTTMTGGKVLLTAGVEALPSNVKALVLRRVATFSEFTADNDPHGEHDFGSFEIAGSKLF